MAWSRPEFNLEQKWNTSLWLSIDFFLLLSLSFRFQVQFFQKIIYSSLVFGVLPFPHVCFWKYFHAQVYRTELSIPATGSLPCTYSCNHVYLHWQFNHIALICHKRSLTVTNNVLIDWFEWNTWQWLKVRLTWPSWNISETIQVFFPHMYYKLFWRWFMWA